MTPFSALGLVAAAVAVAVHTGFFVLETLAFNHPRVRRLFGVPGSDDSRSLRIFAANQGVYNLALAVVVAVGIAVAWDGALALGFGIALAGLAVMVVAALALVVSSPRMWLGAVVQGLPSAIGAAGILSIVPSAALPA